MQRPTMIINPVDFPFVPGCTKVLYSPGRNTEYYCQTCKAFIKPIWIRREEYVFAACLCCLYNDMAEVNKANGGELGNMEDPKTASVSTAQA